jgi:MFS family permease
MTIIDGVILSGWMLFFNFYMLERGYSRDFLGLVQSLPSLAGLVFGIPIGRLSDRIGRKTSIMLGISLASACMLIQVTTRQPAVIVVMAFLAGIFNMLFIISQAPLMMKLSDDNNRTLLFSLNYGLQTIASAVGSVFAGQLPAAFGAMLNVSGTSAAAYQAVLITSVLLGTTALIPMSMVREPRALPAESKAEARGSGLSSSLTRLIVRLASPNLLIGFGAAILIPYMNVFFKDRFAISDAFLGALFSLSSLLIGVGSIIGPRLAVRLGGKVRAVAFTQLLSLIFLLTIGFTPYLWLAAISMLMRAALMNMASPLYSAFCMEQSPEHEQGLVNSVLSISWQLGWAVGPYLSGVVQARYGFTPLFVTTGILYGTAILVMWTLFSRVETRPDPKGFSNL